MIVERPARPAVLASPQEASPAGVPLTAPLRKAWDVFWWRLRAHMADVHGLPRDRGLDRPPAAWLRRWPRGHN